VCILLCDYVMKLTCIEFYLSYKRVIMRYTPIVIMILYVMTPSGFVCGYHLFKTAVSLLRVP